MAAGRDTIPAYSHIGSGRLSRITLPGHAGLENRKRPVSP
jgi:hypothetical protein